MVPPTGLGSLLSSCRDTDSRIASPANTSLGTVGLLLDDDDDDNDDADDDDADAVGTRQRIEPLHPSAENQSPALTCRRCGVLSM